MAPWESGDIAGAAEGPNLGSSFLRLRLATGVLLLVAATATAFAWAMRAEERIVGSVYSWRVAFVAVLGALLLNAPLLWPLWRGHVHLRSTLVRPVPFAPGEFVGRGRVRPGLDRTGVSGRVALLGGVLTVLGALLWVGGLAFAPADTSGTLSLRAGQGTSDLRPSGLRVGNSTYAYVLPHEHVFFGLTDDAPRSAVMRAQTPSEGQGYVVRPGEPVPLGPHHLSLVSTALGPPASGLRLRIQAPGVDEVITLPRRVPIPVGVYLLELVGLEEHVLDAVLPGARVRVARGDEARELWLLPGAAGIDAAFGTADELVLTPLEIVGTERIVLRFTQRWVWYWRLAVLGFVGLGAFLILLIPHRTWFFAGRPGDYELRAWSLNATGALRDWSAAVLRESLGESGYEELCSIDDELASRARGQA